MPWQVVSTVSQRYEFVMLARQEGANVSLLCSRFGISRAKGYKWLGRFAAEGAAGLEDRSRRPKTSPRRTPQSQEKAVCDLLGEHPTWGGRKVHNRLKQLGHSLVPSPATITAIKHREGLIGASGAAPSKPCTRFEHAHPHDLLQMDFKGHFATGEGRCHPLTVVDDCSRYVLAIEACADERGETVQACLTVVFRCYGLPLRMTMDNGAPWGSGARHDITPFALWLMRLGIRVGHSRPRHPQTQGKAERFHRTLREDVIAGRIFPRLADCQAAFQHYRRGFNFERPHEALDGAVPASRFRPSPRPFPERLPAIDYPDGANVRKVQQGGWLSYKGHDLRLPKGLCGHPVALQSAHDEESIIEVYFCATRIATFDLRANER